VTPTAQGLDTLLAVVLVAALAPAVVAVLPGPRIPQVVVLIFGGILIGPQGLDIGHPASISLLSDIGLRIPVPAGRVRARTRPAAAAIGPDSSPRSA
jgi:hypothetical protein